VRDFDTTHLFPLAQKQPDLSLLLQLSAAGPGRAGGTLAVIPTIASVKGAICDIVVDFAAAAAARPRSLARRPNAFTLNGFVRSLRPCGALALALLC
jgi:hypothetical protein